MCSSSDDPTQHDQPPHRTRMLRTAPPAQISYDLRRPIEFRLLDQLWRVALLDDDVDVDPTLLVFRGLEEEAVATIHLDPRARELCADQATLYGHIVVREGDSE